MPKASPGPAGLHLSSASRSPTRHFCFPSLTHGLLVLPLVAVLEQVVSGPRRRGARARRPRGLPLHGNGKTERGREGERWTTIERKRHGRASKLKEVEIVREKDLLVNTSWAVRELTATEAPPHRETGLGRREGGPGEIK